MLAIMTKDRSYTGALQVKDEFWGGRSDNTG